MCESFKENLRIQSCKHCKLTLLMNVKGIPDDRIELMSILFDVFILSVLLL